MLLTEEEARKDREYTLSLNIVEINLLREILNCSFEFVLFKDKEFMKKLAEELELPLTNKIDLNMIDLSQKIYDQLDEMREKGHM